MKISIWKAQQGTRFSNVPEITVPGFYIGPKRQALLKGLCHYDIAVLGPFCAEVIV